MIELEYLLKQYNEQKLSVKQISVLLGCSANRVTYWMNVYGIKRRSISEAVYQRINPTGDPFTVIPPKNRKDAELFGMGVGLYWGEGTRANKYSVRLGNTDPLLLSTFMRFLIELYGVKKDDFHFGLQIFTDINPMQALKYWCDTLAVKSSQFYAIHTTISGSIGTYRKKSTYGVVTIYYHNKKLRDILVGLLPT